MADAIYSEVFDPAAQLWSLTGTLTTTRWHHSMVRLNDGRVLVAGGWGSLQTAEIFNPATMTWAPTGSMLAGHSDSPTAVLADGRVLITTAKVDTAYEPQAELWNPASGTWSATAGLPSMACVSGTATLLADGRVLLVCGMGVEVFNPASGTFTKLYDHTNGRSGHVAVTLQDGRVLLAGGKVASQIFDPATNAFLPAGSMSSAHTYLAGARAADGTVVIAGGLDSTGGTSAVVERFHPSTGAWTLEAPLLQARQNAKAALLPSGDVLVVGGNYTVGNVGYPIDKVHGAELIPGVCTPLACGGAGAQCGTVPDGCGGVLECGGCAEGTVCSAGTCCAPTTCAAAGAICGSIPDGCGGTLSCGSCGPGQACANGTCVCIPTTCAGAGVICGTLPDGCGGTLTCNSCPSGTTCDLVAGQCKAPPGQAAYDPVLKATACTGEAAVCDSGTLLNGRAGLGPELHAPNTLDGCADGTSGTYHLDESLDGLRISTVDGGAFQSGKTVRVDATVWAYSGYTYDYLDVYYAANAMSPSWVFVATLTPTGAGKQTLSTTYALPVGGPRQAVRGVFRYGGSAAACLSGGYNDRDDLVFDVAIRPDLLPPAVAISSPAAGATVSGDVQLRATASDDVAVTRVDYYATSSAPNSAQVLIGSATVSPYAVVWNSRSEAGPTAYVLTAKAYDTAGHEGLAAPVGITVDNRAPATAVYSATYRAPACFSPGIGCDSGASLVRGRAGLGPEQNAPNTIDGCADGTAGTFHVDESIDQLRIATTDGSILRSGAPVRVTATVWAYSTADTLDVYSASSASSPVWTLVGTAKPAGSGVRTLTADFTLPSGSLQAVRAVFRWTTSRWYCSAGPYDDQDDLVFATQ